MRKQRTSNRRAAGPAKGMSLPDGKGATSTNIITQVEGNHITWQSTQRSVDSKELPDTMVVKLKRVQ